MRIIASAFAALAMFFAAVGLFALARSNVHVGVACLVLSLLLIAMTMPLSLMAAPLKQAADQDHLHCPNSPMLASVANDNDLHDETEIGSIPTLHLTGSDEDENTIDALLTNSMTPILIAVGEHAGFVHTLVVPNVMTRLLSEDDLRGCA